MYQYFIKIRCLDKEFNWATQYLTIGKSIPLNLSEDEFCDSAIKIAKELEVLWIIILEVKQIEEEPS